MSNIRYGINQDDIDWIEDAEEYQSISSKKEALRRDISRIDEMDRAELEALDGRVFVALADTTSRIEKFHAQALSSKPDEEDLDWLRRADYSRLSFLRARKLIHRRKVLIQSRITKKAKKETAKEHSKLAFQQMETARKRQEEKTKRHALVVDRELRITKKVIGLIRNMGILTEDQIISLYHEAEAILGLPKQQKGGDANG